MSKTPTSERRDKTYSQKYSLTALAVVVVTEDLAEVLSTTSVTVEHRIVTGVKID